MPSNAPNMPDGVLLYVRMRSKKGLGPMRFNVVKLKWALRTLGRTGGQVFMSIGENRGLKGGAMRTPTRFCVKVPWDTKCAYTSYGTYSVAGALDECYRSLRFEHDRSSTSRDLSRWKLADS